MKRIFAMILVLTMLFSTCAAEGISTPTDLGPASDESTPAQVSESTDIPPAQNLPENDTDVPDGQSTDEADGQVSGATDTSDGQGSGVDETSDSQVSGTNEMSDDEGIGGESSSDQEQTSDPSMNDSVSSQDSQSSETLQPKEDEGTNLENEDDTHEDQGSQETSSCANPVSEAEKNPTTSSQEDTISSTDPVSSVSSEADPNLENVNKEPDANVLKAAPARTLQSTPSSQVTLSISPENPLVNETITVSASAPGATSIAIYGNGEEVNRENGESAFYYMSMTSDDATMQFYAIATINGEQIRSDAKSVRATSIGTIDDIEVSCPSTVRVGEVAQVSITENEHVEQYYISVYDENHTRVQSGNLKGGVYSLTFDQIGSYTISVYARAPGYITPRFDKYIQVTENEAIAPSVTVISDISDVVRGDTITFEVSYPDSTITGFKYAQFNNVQSSVFSAANGRTTVQVKVSEIRDDAFVVSFCAVLADGTNSPFSESISIPASVLNVPIASISCPSSLSIGNALTVNVTDIADNIDEYSVFLCDADGNYVTSKGGTEKGQATVTFSEELFNEGTYSLHVTTYIHRNGTAYVAMSDKVYVTCTGTRISAPTVTADADVFYVEDAAEFTVSAPGADSISWTMVMEYTEGGSAQVGSNTVEVPSTGIVKVRNYIGGKPGTVTFTVTASFDGVSSESASATATVDYLGILDTPVITLPGKIIAGQDMTFQFTWIDQSENMFASLYAPDGSYPSVPSLDKTGVCTIPGNSIKAGVSRLQVDAFKTGYQRGRAVVEFTAVAEEGIVIASPEVMPDHTSCELGDVVNFTVMAPGADSIRYGNFEKGGETTVSLDESGETQVSMRMCVQSGNVRIPFYALYGETWSEATEVTVDVVAYSLANPEVTVSSSFIPGDTVTVSWNPIEHARSYLISLEREVDGAFVYTVNKVTLGETSCTFSGETMTSGNYRVIVRGSMVGYINEYGSAVYGNLSGQGSAEFRMSDELEGPDFTMSPAEIQGGLEYTTLSVTAAGAEEVAYYVIFPNASTYSFRNAHTLTNGSASFQASFTDGGVYTIAMMAKYNGVWSKLGPSKQLTVKAVDDTWISTEGSTDPNATTDVVFTIAGAEAWRGTDGNIIPNEYLAYVNEPVTLYASGTSHEKLQFMIDGSAVGNPIPFGDGYASMPYTFTSVGDYSLYGDMLDAGVSAGHTLTKIIHVMQRSLGTLQVVATSPIKKGEKTTIVWNSIPAAEGYTVLIQAPDGSQTNLEVNAPSTGTEAGPLDQVGTYNVLVTAHAQNQPPIQGNCVVTVHETAEEGQTHITITAPTENTVFDNEDLVISWSHVDDADMYTVSVTAEGSNAVLEGSGTVKGETVTIPASQLTAGKNISIQVVAQYSNGSVCADADGQEQRASKTIAVKAAKPAVIPDFSIISVIPQGFGKPVTVTWNAPVWSGDSNWKPDQYVIWWAGPGMTENKAMTVDGNTLTATLTGEYTQAVGNYAVAVYAVIRAEDGTIEQQKDASQDFAINSVIHGTPVLASADAVAAVNGKFTVTVITDDIVTSISAKNNSGTVMQTKFVSKANGDGTLTWTATYVAEATATERYWTITASVNGVEAGIAKTNSLGINAAPSLTSDKNIADVNTAVTFTLNASGFAGTVTFRADGMYDFGTAVLSNGKATLSRVFNTAGSNRTIEAILDGKVIASTKITIIEHLSEEPTNTPTDATDTNPTFQEVSQDEAKLIHVHTPVKLPRERIGGQYINMGPEHIYRTWYVEKTICSECNEVLERQEIYEDGVPEAHSYELVPDFIENAKYEVCKDDPTYHYLADAIADMKCVCGAVIHDNRVSYSANNSPLVESHSFDSNGKCEKCGYKFKMDEKEKAAIEYRVANCERNGINPMEDPIVEFAVKFNFMQANYNKDDIEEMLNVLSSNDESTKKYRLIYLYSFTKYDLEKFSNEEEISNYNHHHNKIYMYGDTSSNGFFHEAGHAAQDQMRDLQTLNLDKQKDREHFYKSSKLYENEMSYYDALEEDYKKNVHQWLCNYIASASTLDKLELLRDIAEDYEYTGFYTDEQNALIDALNDIIKDLNGASYLAIEEKEKEFLEYYNNLYGKNVKVSDLSLFTDDEIDSFLDYIEGYTNKSEVDKWVKESEFMDYYCLYYYLKKLEQQVINEFKANYKTSNGVYMGPDIYGGLTNNVFWGTHGENYYYFNDSSKQYKEIDEAWAEFFSAKINNFEDAINSNKYFFPTATIELDQYADILLEELRKQSNTSPLIGEHAH